MKNIVIGGLLLALTGCENLFPDPEPAAHPKAVFESLWQEFDLLYAPFEERQVDWHHLYRTYAPQIAETSSDEQLYQVLTQMLAHLDDGHVHLTAPGKEMYYANRVYREKINFELFNREVVKEGYLKREVAEEGPQEGNFLYGLTEDDVVYLHFGYVNESWRHVKTLKEKYPTSPGMIIDLRHNEGGDFTYALHALAELNDQKRLVFRSRTKNGPGVSDFSPWFSWFLESAGNGYPKKVVVLTDRFTISAAERATLMLQALPTVVTIGDTTNGALSTMIPRGLPNGWYYTLAPQDVLAPDGNAYEGIGLAPDIVVTNKPDEMARGVDRVLEQALAQFK